MKTLIYQSCIYKIGGIETWLYNFVKYYKDKDITIVYKEADNEQLYRLSKYCLLEKDRGQFFNCDLCILSNYNANIHLRRISAKQIIQMIHADFSVMQRKYKVEYKHDKRVDKIISVSKTAHDGLLDVYGLESDIIYNIPDYEIEDKKVLKLITMSRCTQEKGMNRIIKMAREFNKHNKNFIWYLCMALEQADMSLLSQIKAINQFKIVEPNIDNKSLINGCDYLVQLSDTESYCYSVAEALQRHVPVITTNYPATYELVKDNINGYILDMELSNLDVDKVFNHIPIVKDYKDLCDTKQWDKILNNKGLINKKRREERMKEIRVLIKEYMDLKPRETKVNGVEPKILKTNDGVEYFMAHKGDILTVLEERAAYLVNVMHLCEYVNIEIEEPIVDNKEDINNDNEDINKEDSSVEDMIKDIEDTENKLDKILDEGNVIEDNNNEADTKEESNDVNEDDNKEEKELNKKEIEVETTEVNKGKVETADIKTKKVSRKK